jgi:subtilisin family serine protease
MNPPSVHPLARFFAALLAIAAPLLAAPDSERLGQETIAVSDGTRTRRFAVARDEIGVAAPGGQTRIVKVAAAASAEAVRQRGRQPDMRAAGQTDLVLYEEGKPRTEAHRRWATARVLVKARAGADLAAIAADVGAASFTQPGYAPGHVIFTAPAGAGNGLALAASLQRHAGIESAEPMLARQAAKRFTPNDPYFADNAANAGYQWHLKNTGARGGLAGIDANVSTAWDTVRGAGIRIGIVDDGLDLAHPDLSGNIDAASDYDFNGADSDPQAEGGDDHGSAAAGVAGAEP